MDGSRFDTLTRSLTERGPRRTLLRLLSGGALGLAGWTHAQPAQLVAAKKCKKIRNKQKRKKCRAKAKACVPSCAGKVCGDDGCGGVCGGCGAGLTCCAGKCVDVATNPANCGSCGRSCISGGCIHGACTCTTETQCPATCDCFQRLQGEPSACAPGDSATPCDEDADCALGSICAVGAICSMPCSG
jgi:hypothetical protein